MEIGATMEIGVNIKLSKTSLRDPDLGSALANTTKKKKKKKHQ